MRDINTIIVHCSATVEGQQYHARDIDRWHKAKGWRGIGYHYVVTLDGHVELGRSISEQGAHCKPKNPDSIGVCYIGGLDEHGKPKDTRTPAQKTALRRLLGLLCHAFPNATLHGHNEYANKSCPCFNVAAEYGRRCEPEQGEIQIGTWR